MIPIHHQPVDHPLPLVSVIVPTFNARPFLPDCIASIKMQSHGNIEIVVVDDGSTDESGKWIRKAHPDVNYIWQTNGGSRLAPPRNKGAHQARGDILAFLDADDVMMPHHVANAVAFFARNPTAVATISNYQNFDDATGAAIGPPHFNTCERLSSEGGLAEGVETVKLSGVEARRILAVENFASMCGLLIRKSVFDDVGGFNDSLLASEDFDLVFRAARRGEIGVFAEEGFRRRMHTANLSKQSRRMVSQKLDSRSRLLKTEDDPIVADRLRSMLNDINVGIAMNRNEFTRSERFKALINAIKNCRQVGLNHLKAVVNLIR